MASRRDRWQRDYMRITIRLCRKCWQRRVRCGSVSRFTAADATRIPDHRAGTVRQSSFQDDRRMQRFAQRSPDRAAAKNIDVNSVPYCPRSGCHLRSLMRCLRHRRSNSSRCKKTEWTTWNIRLRRRYCSYRFRRHALTSGCRQRNFCKTALGNFDCQPSRSVLRIAVFGYRSMRTLRRHRQSSMTPSLPMSRGSTIEQDGLPRRDQHGAGHRIVIAVGPVGQRVRTCTSAVSMASSSLT